MICKPIRTVRLLFIFILTFYSFASQAQNDDAKSADKPFVLGVVHTFKSAILGEDRVLNICLPEGYASNDTAHYPVVYLLDGGADEDFIHIAGLYQFSSFPWVNRVPASIIVGIANTDRKRDFTYPTSITADLKRYPSSGHSAQFMNFLEKELQPYINQTYRTNGSKTIIGESLGGLLATEILLKRPELFNRYIIVSPSLWWDDGSLLRLPSSVLEKSFVQNTQIYIGVGKEGLWPGDKPHVGEVDANVLADRLQHSESKSLMVYFDYLPGEDHATISHQAILNALKFLAHEP